MNSDKDKAPGPPADWHEDLVLFALVEHRRKHPRSFAPLERLELDKEEEAFDARTAHLQNRE